ncbi:MAG: flagellar biosynthesis protein FlhB [Alphaproteobacteria bacterium]|nr:flagellar biosynthesis protein FlhB [Alphaproteobacteria bacterium]
MAEDQDPASKTEEPTSNRLDDARQKGQIAHSQEVNHWFMIAAITLAAATMSGWVGTDIFGRLRALMEAAHDMPLEPEGMAALLAALARSVGLALLPVIALLAAAALLGNMVQHPVGIAAERIKPQLKRLSPLAGLKRIFSARGISEFVKGILKLCLVGAVGTWLVWPRLDSIPQMVTADPVGIMRLVLELSLTFLAGVAAVLAFIAGADLLYQKWEHRKGLRMSRQEIKDEIKQSEGDPQIKARIRALRLERSRRRMMAAVPGADVVVTNPTHFAVALKYEMEKMGAPRVVAKGQDLIAFAIRELAGKHRVPVVENPPLARALFAACDIDQEIPTEHYKAVAEIISYVMRLKGARLPARGRMATPGPRRP